jgi:hypothetical protein
MSRHRETALQFYVIRHILHVSRPNSKVRSEWRKSTRIIYLDLSVIDRINQQEAGRGR